MGNVSGTWTAGEKNGCTQTLGEAEWRQAGPGLPGPGDGKETEVGHGGK